MLKNIIIPILCILAITGCSTGGKDVKPDATPDSTVQCPMPSGTDLKTAIEITCTTLTRCPEKLEEVFVALLNVGKYDPKLENKEIIINAWKPLADNNFISKRDLETLWNSYFDPNTYTYPPVDVACVDKTTLAKAREFMGHELKLKELALVDCCQDQERYSDALTNYNRFMRFLEDLTYVVNERESVNPANDKSAEAESTEKTVSSKSKLPEATPEIIKAMKELPLFFDNYKQQLDPEVKKLCTIVKVYQETCGPYNGKDTGCMDLANQIREQYISTLRRIRENLSDLEKILSNALKSFYSETRKIYHYSVADLYENEILQKEIFPYPRGGLYKSHQRLIDALQNSPFRNSSLLEFYIATQADLIASSEQIDLIKSVLDRQIAMCQMKGVLISEISRMFCASQTDLFEGLFEFGTDSGLQPSRLLPVPNSFNLSVVPLRGSMTMNFAMDSGYSSGSSFNEPSYYVPPQYNTDEYDRIHEDRFLEVIGNPPSTFSIDVDTAAYSNVRRFINDSRLPPSDAVRIEEMINYFTYTYPQPQDKHPFSITTELSQCPWEPGHLLVHIGLQGKKVPAEMLPESNLVFLIDVSGSMNDSRKLPLLKQAFRLLIDQLTEKDLVSIVVYAGSSGVVLSPTTGAEKAAILHAIENLKAGGSTAGGEGIVKAFDLAKAHFRKTGNNRVILATDGDFNVGVSNNADLVRLIEEKRDEGIFLTVLGFGRGNYKDSKMEQLADAGNGNYAYIDNIREAKKVLVNELGGTLLTIAKDVKIQVEFNPTKVKSYQLIGYENRKLSKEDFTDDKKDAGDLGSGHSVTALYEIIPASPDDAGHINESLKYQKATIKPEASKTNEVMWVKLRYKQPGEDKSLLLEHPVLDLPVPLDETSDNFRFSAAVAEFGLLLRKSQFRGKSSYDQVLQSGKGAKGKDEQGYRAEFLGMVETAQLLQDMKSGK